MKHKQGEVHAFLSVRDDDGKIIGYADEVNVQVGNAWRSRLTIHFLDGSLHDESTLYTQGKILRLLMDHLVQKGPAFKKPTDMTIDATRHTLTYHEEKDGKDESKTETMDLPPDLANGMMPIVLQNLPRGTQEIKMGYVVGEPKPRLVKFAIHREGTAAFKTGTMTHTADHYRIHIEIGGVAGVVAPMVGKEPPDLEAWVSAGEAPTFLKVRGILYLGGPQWTLQLISPQW